MLTVLPFVISANSGDFVRLSSNIEKIAVGAQRLSIRLRNGKLHEIQTRKKKLCDKDSLLCEKEILVYRPNLADRPLLFSQLYVQFDCESAAGCGSADAICW